MDGELSSPFVDEGAEAMPQVVDMMIGMGSQAEGDLGGCYPSA